MTSIRATSHAHVISAVTCGTDYTVRTMVFRIPALGAGLRL